MKAVALVGSPRFGGNTELLAAHSLRAIAEEGIETELIRLTGLSIAPCRACQACRTTGVCATSDDFVPVFEKMKAADAIILASPVYYGSATALIKALMERAGYASRASQAFRGKVGGPLVVARRAGKNFTFAQLTLWFQILGFFIPGASYWNVAVAREPGEVSNDAEGLNTARDFGKQVAFLLKKLKA